MATRLNPYLNFDGECRDAMTFYAQVFGATLEISTFGEAGMADAPNPDHVMHAMLETANGWTLMASDMPPGETRQSGNDFSVSLSGDEAFLRETFTALAEGGTVMLPLTKAPWGDEFGMAKDRFGVQWMVNIATGTP
jgi:PhnB protein